MRKVFLEELPRWEKGTNEGKINWSKCIGYNVKFVYDDIVGEVKIIDYSSKCQKIVIKYLNEELFDIKTGDFSNCRLGKLLKRKTSEFIYAIGESLKDDKRDLIITDREYRLRKRNKKDKTYIENKKYYKYTCNVCKWTEGWMEESNLKNKRGCSCCSGKTVVLGINTIWDTDKWLVDDFGLDEEFAKLNTKGTDKKGKFTCVNCKEPKFISVYSVISNMSIGCKKCGDGVTYPEKFMISVLNQLGVKYRFQLTKTTFDWCGKYKYDFYVPSLNCIIETHGLQHYEQAKGFYKSLVNEQENDRIKRELALANGIDKYIIIDCRHSDSVWIRNSILNSRINELFDLSKVDWLMVEEFATSNLVKEVCDYWNNKKEWETTANVAIRFNLSQTTIINYLKAGNKLYWCSYNTKLEMSKNGSKNGKANKRPVEVFRDGKSLGVFDSVLELERKSEELFGVKFNHSAASSVANDSYCSDFYKGYLFKYIY